MLMILRPGIAGQAILKEEAGGLVEHHARLPRVQSLPKSIFHIQSRGTVAG